MPEGQRRHPGSFLEPEPEPSQELGREPFREQPELGPPGWRELPEREPPELGWQELEPVPAQEMPGRLRGAAIGTPSCPAG